VCHFCFFSILVLHDIGNVEKTVRFPSRSSIFMIFYFNFYIYRYD
jgi:hypothetical protein